jgi:hypothetical protein
MQKNKKIKNKINHKLVYIYKKDTKKYITLSDLAIIFLLKTESVPM